MKEVEVEVESAKNEVKVEICGDLQSMTIQQLRTMSKNIGISARGSKQALVSALQCFLQKEEDGRNSPVNSEKNQSNLEISPSISKEKNSPAHECGTSKRKAKNKQRGDEDQNSNHVTEISKSKRKKGTEKSPTEYGINLEVNSKDLISSPSLSVITKETSDKNSYQTKRKELPKIDTEDGDKFGQTGISSEPWTILAHKKPQVGWIPYNPKTMRPPPLDDGTTCVKLISWNVNGLRALLKLDSLSEFARTEDFDVLCFQETKLQEKDVEKIKEHLIDGYDNSFWTCSVSKLGYSGTAIISRIKPLSIKYGLGILDHDSEGRLVTVEFDKYYLVSGYVPNSGDGLRRLTYRVTQWDPSLGEYLKELEKSKPVILTGDLNCAHQEIDIFNPAGNKRSAGFTVEERESFEKNFLSKGFVDTFRRQHPGVVGYTYWGFRHGGRVNNKGWRLDYFLVSESIADQVHDSYIVPDVTGSDHCPIGLILKL